MKKALICILLFAYMLSFTSCGTNSEKTAEELMREFSEAYGGAGVIYSPSVPEGERGYCGGDFFYSLYEREEDGIADYAVLLLSHLDGAGECAVFLCRTANDALLAAGMCEDRRALLRSSYGIDTTFADESFLLRKGRVTVFCALSDNEKAKKIWKKLL